MNFSNSIQINIIGDFAVGKTSIINSFSSLGFNDITISNIGIDKYVIPIYIENKEIKLNIFDTAGQERYHSLTLNSIRKCEGLILVYSRNDHKTFDNISNVWINSINEIINLNQTPCVLVENKCDLDLDSNIKEDKINELIKKYNLLFIRASAKENKNIKEIFQNLAEMIVNKKNQIYILDDSNKIKEIININFKLNKTNLKNKNNRKCSC